MAKAKAKTKSKAAKTNTEKKTKKYRYSKPYYGSLVFEIIVCTILGILYYFFRHWFLAVMLVVEGIRLILELLTFLPSKKEEKKYPSRSPDEMKKDLLALIGKEIPDPYKEEMSRQVKACIRVVSQAPAEEDLPVGASKLGGLPDLPPEVEWPYDGNPKAEGEFLAQFNLAELGQLDEEQMLPQKGMLYFFIFDHTEAKVLYFDRPLKELQRKAPPEKAAIKLSEECAVDFRKEYRAPGWDSVHLWIYEKEKGIAGPAGDDFPEEYHERVCKVCNMGDDFTDHHFLGYADTIQSGQPELEMAFPKVNHYNRLSVEELRSALEWRLLFQLDSDENANMMFGDAGRYYFLVNAEDLRKGCFMNVKVTMDCY